MKVAIINPNTVENDPYIKYFTDVFDRLEIKYEYICWNRDYIYTDSYKDNKTEIFNYLSSIKKTSLKKTYDYLLFSEFVKSCLKKTKYDLLVVHTIPSALFLGRYISKNYRNRFIFDIRDYSPAYPYFRRSIRNVIKASAFTTISSPAYKKWLPNGIDYVTSHNVRKIQVENVAKNLDNGQDIRLKKEIVVLTIGQIRDFSANSRVIISFGNKKGIKLIFAGDGLEKHNLEAFSKGKYSNVHFSGRFKKEDEQDIVRKSDIINIVLPIGIEYDTPMSIRFYLALLNKKPMIVNEESFQAEYVRKYNLGIVVSSNDDIYKKMLQYIENYDPKEFAEGCIKLLNFFREDINIFEDSIAQVCK